MKKKRTINLIGWVLAIFLGIINVFYKEEFSIITTGLGGLICIILMLVLILYKPKPRSVDM